MSIYSKIQKNAQNFRVQDVLRNMTPEEYEEGIRRAVKMATDTMTREYQDRLIRLENEYNEKIREGVRGVIDTISVELLYELASQLECFDENPEYMEDKIYRVKEIYMNTMKAIDKYTKYKNEKQANKEFKKRKKKLEKIFDMSFNPEKIIIVEGD